MLVRLILTHAVFSILSSSEHFTLHVKMYLHGCDVLSLIVSGFSNPSMATLLYHLGPNTATSNKDALLAIRKKCHLDGPDDKNIPSDLTIIPANPISDREIEKLLDVRVYIRVH